MEYRLLKIREVCENGDTPPKRYLPHDEGGQFPASLEAGRRWQVRRRSLAFRRDRKMDCVPAASWRD